MVSAGARHTCAIDSDGFARCWGSNVYGQLDLLKHRATPVCRYCRSGELITDPKSRSYEKCEDLENTFSVEQPLCRYECSWPANSNWTAVLRGYKAPFYPGIMQVAEPDFRRDGRFACSASKVTAGGSHTCVLYGDPDCGDCNFGLVLCYGSNLHGQLDVPKNTTIPLAFIDVSAGLFHTCGVTFGQELLCWGDNRFGQCDAPAGQFSNVSAGAYHSCAVAVGGRLACWGNNSYGQAQSHADLAAAGAVPAGARFVSVSSGASHACGVALRPGHTLLAQASDADTGGEVVCWGANYAGQASPPPTALKYATAVSVGWDHSCAVGLRDLAVVCWGGSNWAQKGSGLGGLGEPTARVPGCVNVCEACYSSSAHRAAAPSARWAAAAIAVAVAAWGCGCARAGRQPPA